MEEIDFEASNRLQNANTYGDISFSDIDFEASNSLRNDALRKLYPREADAVDMGVIIGTELLGTVLGGIATGGSPLGFAGGSALGNYLSQQYRINQGLQSDIGLGELGAATVLGGVPVGKFANVGMAGKTAIRAGQGAGLATGELLARTFIDEDRAPTQEEIATTLLFGGAFGGTLGAVEAKFLKDLGLPAEEGQKRLEFKEAVQEQVREAGGASNYEVGRPVGFFTFRDPQGNFTFKDPDTTELTAATSLDPVTGLGPRRLRQLDQPQLPGPRGLGGPQQARIGQSRTLTDDGVIEVDAIPVEDYAEGLLSGIENKLLLESEDMIKGISSGQELSPEMQNLKKAFEAKLASDNEIFTGVNPIVAKGNIGDTRRLREIDEEIAKLDHLGSAGEQGDIALGLRRPPTVNPNLTKLSDDAFDAVEIKARKELDKLEDNYFNQGGMEQNNLGLKRKLAAAQDAYSAVELEKFRRQIAGEEPWFIASEFRTLAGGTQNAETVFKLALLGETVKKRGIQQELFDELNANVGKDINAQEVFADQINKAKLATERFKKKNLTQKVPLSKQRKQLEKEKRALERKHNIVQNVLLGGAGVSAAASMFTEDEEASGSSLAMAGLLGFFGIRKNKQVTEALAKGARKGEAQNARDEAIRAKGGIPDPDPEPIGRAAVEAERRQAAGDRIPARRIAPKDDIKRSYSDELIKQLEETNDPNIQNMLTEELAERASRNTARGRRLRNKLFNIVTKNPEISDETFNAINIARDTPLGTQKTNQDVRGYSQAKNAELVQLAKNGDPEALKQIRKRAAKNPKTKKLVEREGLITGLLTTGTGAIALMEMMDDDDDSVSRASLGGFELLVALALSAFGYRQAKKYIKSAEFKKAKAQIKANPSAAEPDIIKQARIDQTLERNPFAPPGEFKEAMKSAQDFVRNALQPMSRTLKNINKALPAVFRKHEGEIATKTREYMDKVSPFIVSMTKRLKDNPNKQRLFKQYLLNGEYTKISDEILTPNAPQVLFDQMGEMRKSLDDLRSYARQRGGIDVGYIEAYFPRKIKNYNHFRKALDEEEGLGGIRTELDKALDDYAAKNNISSRDAIPTDEAAEVVSRALRTPPSGGMTPGNVKMRSIESVSPRILDAYADPAEALGDYVQRMVQATERRNFLLRKPDASGSKVGFQGSQDTINADLGMRMEVSEDMVGALADRLRRENKLSQEDVDKLKEVIRARFNSKTVSPFFQGVKNANYIAVMGNFGSAITQLGDLAYSIHFNGFDNTFKTLFNRKDNFDFVKHFGLSDSSIDAVTSSKGLSKVLDDVFTFTQLKRLDQLGKNTTMNASWKKFKAQAQKDAPGLRDELAPVFGKERAGQMVNQLQQSNPASKNLPKAVEELIWYKFLDLSPATLGEMPLYYNTSGNMRIAYMLKSFTLKQFDVFREAGSRDIEKAKLLYKEGKTREAVKSATKGMNKVLGLAVVFAAANASTDVIKDMMYGRPIKKNDLLADNALKLLGINRYLAYKAKREGIGKAVLETMLPPMTLFDRGGKDLDDLLSGKEYKGNLLQGTPLDIIYWRYLGGVDKVKNMQ